MEEQKFQVNCGFFDSINNDRLYSADEMNRPYKRIISNGIFATPKGSPSKDLQVLESNNEMEIIVKKGEGLIGNKWYENPRDLAIQVPINTDVKPRIDSVIAQIDKSLSGRCGNIVYRCGIPNDIPEPPTINLSDEIIEMRVANICVTPTTRFIDQSMITDLRGSEDCPWITSLLNQVDTSELYKQYHAAYRNFYNEETKAFNNFMESLTSQLTVNTNIKKFESHYITNENDQKVIPINIETYNKNKDILIVRINKLFATEDIDYSISDDSLSIILSKGISRNQSVDFLILQSVIAGNTATVMNELEKLIKIFNKTKITDDNGTEKIILENATSNVLDTFSEQASGFYTLSVNDKVQGLPQVGHYKLFGQLLEKENGYLFAIQDNGSIYVNYLNKESWCGWRSLFEVENKLLFKANNTDLSTLNNIITPSKKLSACQHGWILVFSKCDIASSTAIDAYIQTIVIPKVSVSNKKWEGEEMIFSFVYSEQNTVMTCIKKFLVYDTRIVESTDANSEISKNIVLRSIQEF